MDWGNATLRYHKRTFEHEGRLSSLSEEWQRELAALWRLEADVNNGAYLQFLVNWGRESYPYASQALKKIGAHRTAAIIDSCQTLVDEHFDTSSATQEKRASLMPNELIGDGGEILKPAGSILPKIVLDRIYELSSEFMDYPDDIERLGSEFYRSQIEQDIAD
jgi:hypothetical protein